MMRGAYSWDGFVCVEAEEDEVVVVVVLVVEDKDDDNKVLFAMAGGSGRLGEVDRELAFPG
jgi:hypothetical protein